MPDKKFWEKVAKAAILAAIKALEEALSEKRD